jgi:cyclic pyranopterin phosphate synthase
MKQLTHVDSEGRAVMVDVGGKKMEYRMAEAGGFIHLQKETLQLIRKNRMKKGDVLTVAEVAGIQAAKRTSELIPLCHPLALTKIDVRAKLETKGVHITSMAKCLGQTGVEMEALTAVSVALLTIYDMCKAVDKKMVIDGIYLVEKRKSSTEI